MPGILPMKVINVGSQPNGRIAQACDRCRSKKIRCDGVSPCCSQCKSVGFECKTSDKLSRRAFPRGYTESLEEKVRGLEAEVRELKALLDEKDEKIDLLSKIHSFASPRHDSTSSNAQDTPSTSSSLGSQYEDDAFETRQPSTLRNDGSDLDFIYIGASSVPIFVDAVKNQFESTGKSVPHFDANALCRTSTCTSKPTGSRKIPPRVVSDQLVNIFFQEWAPLFPVLHRPAFLRLYSDFVADPEAPRENQATAQLNLVFGIAALASNSNKDIVPQFETQWRTAMQSFISECTLSTLQCALLAQIYCIQKKDSRRLVYYRGIAVGVSQHLGLHRSQQALCHSVLNCETRKKIFWTVYTLDCFTAASLGLPKLIVDEDVETEEPHDIDDENLSEGGFQPALPGESTRLSSALALFRLSKVLSGVLRGIYPARSSHEVSIQKAMALSEELNLWQDGLAPHLRLKFYRDKPSTNVISSRCPLLALGYHYVRTLIHRPIATSSIGSRACSSVAALAESSKHIVQIIELLDERHMSFTFCLNRTETLILSGFGLLLQSLDLKLGGKLIQDNQRLLHAIVTQLRITGVAAAADMFGAIVGSIMNGEEGDGIHFYPSSCVKPSRHSSHSSRTTDAGSPAPSLQHAWDTYTPDTDLQSSISPRRATSSAISSTGQPITSPEAGGCKVGFTPQPTLDYRHSVPSSTALPHYTPIPSLDCFDLDSQAAPPNTITNGDSTGVFPTDWDLANCIDLFDAETASFRPSPPANPVPPAAMSVDTPQLKSDWSPEAWDSPGARSRRSAGLGGRSASDENSAGGDGPASCDVAPDFKGYAIPFELEKLKGEDLNDPTGFFRDALS